MKYLFRVCIYQAGDKRFKVVEENRRQISKEEQSYPSQYRVAELHIGQWIESVQKFQSFFDALRFIRRVSMIDGMPTLIDRLYGDKSTDVKA